MDASRSNPPVPQLLLTLALALALALGAWGCAVPHGGCRPAICSQYTKVSPGGIVNQGNYQLPAT